MKERGRIGKIGLAVLAASLIATVGVLAPAPAEAASANSVVILENVSIPEHLRNYVARVEFDPSAGGGRGVRLFLTGRGMIRGLSHSGAKPFAHFVMDQPEWRGDRSLRSVTLEISWHCRFGRVSPMRIEYNFACLSRWEQRFFGR